MSEPPARATAPKSSLASVEVARLAAARRVGLGAAHTLNNLFTVMLGELGFLAEERNRDEQIARACAELLETTHRCVAVTRTLARPAALPVAGLLDPVGLLRELETLLGETLGRLHPIEVRTSGELPALEADAGRLELLLLCCAHAAADATPEGADLELEAAAAPDGVRFVLALRAQRIDAKALNALADPSLARGWAERTRAEAVKEIASAHAGRVAVDADASGGARIEVSLTGVG